MNLCADPHPYEGAPAAVAVKTMYGTYLMCQSCADRHRGQRWVESIEPLTPRLLKHAAAHCRCEHDCHFGFGNDATQKRTK